MKFSPKCRGLSSPILSLPSVNLSFKVPAPKFSSISSSVGKDSGSLDTVLSLASCSSPVVQFPNRHFQMDQGSSSLIPDPINYLSRKDHGILCSSGFSPGLLPKDISSGLFPFSPSDHFPGLQSQHADVHRRFRSQQQSLLITRFQKKVRLKSFWERLWIQFFIIISLLALIRNRTKDSKIKIGHWKLKFKPFHASQNLVGLTNVATERKCSVFISMKYDIRCEMISC